MEGSENLADEPVLIVSKDANVQLNETLKNFFHSKGYNWKAEIGLPRWNDLLVPHQPYMDETGQFQKHASFGDHPKLR